LTRPSTHQPRKHAKCLSRYQSLECNGAQWLCRVCGEDRWLGERRLSPIMNPRHHSAPYGFAGVAKLASHLWHHEIKKLTGVFPLRMTLQLLQIWDRIFDTVKLWKWQVSFCLEWQHGGESGYGMGEMRDAAML
jgi:hypothetical protein